MSGVDPYAARPAVPAVQIEGDPPWRGVVEGLGGWLFEDRGAVPAEARFVVRTITGDGAHAPVARLGTEPVPRYAIKHGWVAGPPGQPGCVEVDAELVEAVVGAELASELEWERDPDFGYEVPVPPAGLTGDRALALRPRLLYTAHGRVYEHAELVARLAAAR